MKLFCFDTTGRFVVSSMWRVPVVLLGFYSVAVGLKETLIEEHCIEDDIQLVCKKLLPNKTYPHIMSLKVTGLKIDDLDFNYFLEAFGELSNLTLIGNNRTRIRSMHFPAQKLNIKVLQLNSLQITNDLIQNITEHFNALEVLNISNNYLTKSPNFSAEGLKEVYMYGNKWNCSRSLEWTLSLNLSVFKDLPDLRCFKMPHNNKPILDIARFRKITAETCTQNCSCRLIKCVTDMNTGVLEPIIEVNCSYRGFRTLPETFPPKTKIIHLEGNEIDDLTILETDLYRSVLDVYLDNNKLTNINVLEGSYWLTHFRVFSLSNNKITELPTYVLDNALKRNINMPDAVRMALGGNPWRCNCVYTPRFKEMLQKYAHQIRDIRDIRCAEGDENALIPIMDLSRSSVCHSPSEYTIQEALDLLNAILGLLIIFILGKLAYDYYNFKKTGRLPWIVTKMP